MSDRSGVRSRKPFSPVAVLAILGAASVLAACAAGNRAAKADRGVPPPGGAAGAPAAQRAGVQGTVYLPAEGVYLYVYRKGEDPHGPAYLVMPAPTLKDGSFSVDLPPGEYTVVARRRSNQDNSGPLLGGDLRSDPMTLAVGASGRVPLTILMNAKDDMEYRAFLPPKEWTTAIAGSVRDADGNAVEGARVHVYTYVQMSERPKYVSERTGPDGRYIVYLPKGGTYYVAARNRFGGPPRIGDLYGRYDEGSIDPTGVVVKEGQTREKIDVTVFKVW